MRLFRLPPLFYRDELGGPTIDAVDDSQRPMSYAKGLLIDTNTGNRGGLL